MAINDKNDSSAELLAMVPDENREFALDILARADIDTEGVYDNQRASAGGFLTEGKATNIIDVAFSHPIKLIANALGVPPEYMLLRCKQDGVVSAALVGAKEHAVKQVAAGVDVLVVAGTEAGGHCGEVSTLVLVPEVVQAVEEFDVPVLAAGGIVTGRQMAACMAMGAAGVWTGSVWLTTEEAETSEVIKEKYLAASSNETVRSQARTGKYSRQLRSPWTDAWESDASPGSLPMPLQGLVSGPPLARVDRLAARGHVGARQLATSFVGQGVGLMNEVLSSRQVVYAFKEDYLEATERLSAFIEE